MQKTQKKILLFYPYNQKAIDQQSVMGLLIKNQFKIFLLTIQPKGEIHNLSSKLGVKCFSIFNDEKNFLYKIINMRIIIISKILWYFYIFIYFGYFIKKNKIEIVFSHLEIPGLISGIYSFFFKFNNYYFRHNTDAHLIDGNIKSKIINKIVNNISKKIICVSERVEKHLIDNEKIKKDKLICINYGYNFEYYLAGLSANTAKQIRSKYNSENLIICVGRFVQSKRHNLLINLIDILNKKYQSKYMLMCLGDGPLKKDLEILIKNLGLQEYVKLIGFKNNVIEHIIASDILVHFSESESFGHVVLEAGLSKKTVIVCDGVGVFNDFIKQDFNGFLVSKENAVDEAYNLLLNSSKEKINKMGINLYDTVTKEYHIDNVEKKYLELINNTKY